MRCGVRWDGARSPAELSSRMGEGGEKAMSADRARALRRNQTEGERLLWNHLRGRRFHGLKFKRQVPVGRYVADFLSVEAKLIVELDGGQHAEQAAADAARTAVLEAHGYLVVRFWNNDVLSNIAGVLQELEIVLGKMH